MRHAVLLASLFFAMTAQALDKNTTSLEKTFASPGNEYKPWVFWFWNNSNLTEEGIKGDLEAMHRVGIGGVLIMEVNQGAPQGPVDFLGDEWRRLYSYMLDEAARLGIEVNMNNDAGWNGSGGKWIKPEYSMQVLTFSEVYLDNTQSKPVKLPEPPKKMDYYKDIAVFAFPTPEGAEARKRLSPNNHQRNPEITLVVTQKDIVDLTGKMAADGTLDWKAPKGKWTVLRIGHTSKGQDVHPAPTSGVGPQCDVLSVEASEIAFEGQIGRLVAENKANVGQTKTFVSTHIDSWEVGSQNWTPLMREEFKKYAGYDIWKFLPVFNGYIVNSPEITDRFLWDFRRAVAKMCMDNHIETFVRLSHKNGLRFSAEAYDSTPCDFLEYAGLTDEPMGEFWVGSNATNEGSRLWDCRGMASAGHVYGKNVVGAEA
ncbi:MAG: glycosyl hydrolase family 43, partial [Candidatus Symbiothrix sp.]|nr:glycosyl hydrolase family 43 [Candidatus Symbiothrix sp.]